MQQDCFDIFLLQYLKQTEKTRISTIFYIEIVLLNKKNRLRNTIFISFSKPFFNEIDSFLHKNRKVQDTLNKS